MNIQAEKLEILKMILETDNPGIIRSIKMIFRKESDSDFWDTLPGNQKEDILEGIDEINRGEVVDYENVIRKHR